MVARMSGDWAASDCHEKDELRGWKPQQESEELFFFANFLKIIYFLKGTREEQL